MAIRNSHTRYGSVTRTLHWLTALLVITLIPVALVANALPFDTSEELTRKAWFFSLHKTLGVAVFFVSLARILWAISQPKPAPLHPDAKAETFLAEVAHWLLYGSLMLVPLSGWIHHAATTGFAPIWWPLGQSLPMVPKSETVAAVFGGAHWVLGKVMAATIALHVLGAVKHQIIDKDATLRRMLNGAPELADLPPSRHGVSPLLGAFVVWAVTLTAGGLGGLYQPHGSTTQAAALAEVSSDWTVQQGDINIAVTQFGSAVEGRFADWTAKIAFDPDVPSGPSGNVEVVISIGSLTLGSVTDQAMGPDFFDAETFTKAIFKADIITGVDGFLAEGTLTIKDQTIPLSMPFHLSVEGDTANMKADLTLDRRDFGIGANMPDESSLAFAVKTSVQLTATKAADQ
ncbi:cytochrome b/b6 domain-containing protein [Sulfitobacter donghicola]|uniref:Cytochrome n=1 Tax=Sulfitobacter donghicola DSW-25 = KCTC 12864 = JCM 14565 TaxID=1300350 RepID=A0A073IL10_9RHOB|nr:cytochrome b/b6 domain-containing protein [Sulfitobacter donghicola]KEJ90191.1 cytochrome [Sulfitobacter donghicola DSW-25 = KCTC 12864 = JCM 14565]KIN66643.1 Cytochrome B561 [Sulfitobacter donghicola DSW-25 = KCTC 12864 = JCM 14565]